MNCAYHIHNGAVVNCNGCGKPLCSACDHRIKGFPFCQDCIVSGVELLRQQNQSSYAPFVKRQTSPLIATILSFVCPGLGAAYNGQTTKALIYFAVFAGLFQMAVMTGMALFVLGFLGMWVFAAVDAWRTAHAIRSGVTPNDAEDILVQRFSGNPKAWGIVLTILGFSFFLQTFLNVRFISKFVLPVLLIGLGVYLLRQYVFKSKKKEQDWQNFNMRPEPPSFAGTVNDASYNSDDSDYITKTRVRNWKNR